MNLSNDHRAPQSADSVPPKTTVLVQYSRRRHLSGCPKPHHPAITSVFSRNRNKPVLVPRPSIPRKTRDLPNISECHACGFRIDLSSGRHRLQTLYSEWRIVLLCRKCISRVESSAICSYCFAEVSDGFRCRDCNRMIHKSCFMDYKSTAPWSYSCSGSEFSVCVDCWVPKSLVQNCTLRRKRSAGKSREMACAITCERIKDSGDIAKPLQNVEKGASSVRGSKNEDCVRSSDDTVVKENVPLLSNSLGAKKDETNPRECNETGASDRVVDDAELAFQLHRSMNSSPRISKKLCLDKNRMSIMVYRRIKKRVGNQSIGTSESGNVSNSESNSIFPMTSLLDSSVNVHLGEPDRVVDRGSSQDDCACIVKCAGEDEKLHVPMKEGKGSTSDGTGTESQSCSKHDESMKLVDVGNVQKDGRYLVTYCKKRLSTSRTSQRVTVGLGFLSSHPPTEQVKPQNHCGSCGVRAVL
ncbi:uncharacterized protein LOC116197678 isoform X1 [Punica granatum]|uniref:Uncharacterized protein LOC116197678 isoform X1 n=1 Tax=Punica granatum TaxID=22663 RepID=A0A218WEU6_PUNGR|nr:uncharacterized protein LOC116197678 isoform X1 [Punica granatum]OWM71364.1 hypothetical protein CDL15_Pgr027015 [Punica granatum]